jgi:SAM-dependent methyltransferase
MKTVIELGITAPFPSYKPELMADALGIKPTDRVLDVGGGHAPLPRANTIVDFNLKGGVDRDSIEAPIDNRWIAGDIHALPFKNKSFDFVYCSHVLEHTEDPRLACEELMRIAQRGYIETPRKLTEMLHGHPTHRWLIDVIDNVLVFERRMFVESPLRNTLLAKLLTDEKAFQTYLMEQRHLTCVQFTWSDHFEYLVIEPPGWKQAFDYRNSYHAGWSHYYFALNLLANEAPTEYVSPHIQEACSLLPNEGLPAALACAAALLNNDLILAHKMMSSAKQLGCIDDCLLEYENMLSYSIIGPIIPLPEARQVLTIHKDIKATNLYQTLNNLSMTLVERNKQITDLYNSTSWKITRPLRFIFHCLKYIPKIITRIIQINNNY